MKLLLELLNASRKFIFIIKKWYSDLNKNGIENLHFFMTVIDYNIHFEDIKKNCYRRLLIFLPDCSDDQCYKILQEIKPKIRFVQSPFDQWDADLIKKVNIE